MQQPETTEWVQRTPYIDSCYALQILDGGRVPETVQMTREEYIALKRHLAGMRGIQVTDAIESE